MKRAASLKVVIRDLHLVDQLLSTENESDLVDLDALLLLKRLLDLENRVVTLEIKALLSASKGLISQISKTLVVRLP